MHVEIYICKMLAEKSKAASPKFVAIRNSQDRAAAKFSDGGSVKETEKRKRTR